MQINLVLIPGNFWASSSVKLIPHPICLSFYKPMHCEINQKMLFKDVFGKKISPGLSKARYHKWNSLVFCPTSNHENSFLWIPFRNQEFEAWLNSKEFFRRRSMEVFIPQKHLLAFFILLLPNVLLRKYTFDQHKTVIVNLFVVLHHTWINKIRKKYSNIDHPNNEFISFPIRASWKSFRSRYEFSSFYQTNWNSCSVLDKLNF